MRTDSRIRLRGVRLLAAAVILFAIPSGASFAQEPAPKEPPAQQEPEKQPQKEPIPPNKFLPKDLPDNATARKEILRDLYEQLAESQTIDEAKLVISAIERLWLTSGSDTVDLLMERTGKLMEDRKFDTAMRLLNSIIELAPDYPEGWNRRAAVQFAQKDFRNSLESLRRALALDPSHFKAVEGLGLLMRELGDDDAALAAFRRLLKINPHSEDAVQAEKELARDVEGQGI